MAQGAHKITEQFEQELSRYTGASYVVCVDNQSNALFLSLLYDKIKNREDVTPAVTIPTNTYPSVPCECIHAGYRVFFSRASFPQLNDNLLKGEYRLLGTRVWDSALTFTAGMYRFGQYQCISFTGPYKHLKLGKGGAILTDNLSAYKWFKKARFSGRDECSYHEDDFDRDGIIGYNFYMPIETAARGLHMMPQFYNPDGSAKDNPDLELPYPDLSKFKCYQ